MSLHFSPFERQLQFGRLQDRVNERESTSKTAVGAGWPLIQSIPSLFSSCLQSCLRGLGISGRFSMYALYRQSAQGGSWSDSMLPLLEQTILYLSSSTLFVHGREFYTWQVKPKSFWKKSSESSHSALKRSIIFWKDLCSLTIRNVSIFLLPAEALTKS